MRCLNDGFVVRLVRFLGEKTGKKNNIVNSHALFLANLFEKIATNVTGKKENLDDLRKRHVEKYIKLQKSGDWGEMGIRLDKNKISEMVLFTLTHRNRIEDMLKELIDMGYIAKNKLGYNYNSSGQVKRDATDTYKINFKKLITDMDNTKYTISHKNKYGDMVEKQLLCLWQGDFFQKNNIYIKLKETFVEVKQEVKVKQEKNKTKKEAIEKHHKEKYREKKLAEKQTAKDREDMISAMHNSIRN